MYLAGLGIAGALAISWKVLTSSLTLSSVNAGIISLH
jgi:hypothetical protein